MEQPRLPVLGLVPPTLPAPTGRASRPNALICRWLGTASPWWCGHRRGSVFLGVLLVDVFVNLVVLLRLGCCLLQGFPHRRRGGEGSPSSPQGSLDRRRGAGEVAQRPRLVAGPARAERCALPSRRDGRSSVYRSHTLSHVYLLASPAQPCAHLTPGGISHPVLTCVNACPPLGSRWPRGPGDGFPPRDSTPFCAQTREHLACRGPGVCSLLTLNPAPTGTAWGARGTSDDSAGKAVSLGTRCLSPASQGPGSVVFNFGRDSVCQASSQQFCGAHGPSKSRP